VAIPSGRRACQWSWNRNTTISCFFEEASLELEGGVVLERVRPVLVSINHGSQVITGFCGVRCTLIQGAILVGRDPFDRGYRRCPP
jgi:hypothetical protein